MINRRSFTALSATGMTAVVIGARMTSAQDAENEIQITNASFIPDIALVRDGTPVASPSVSATPEVALDLDDLHGYILGDPKAPNTLQLYSDYRCPHCRMFHTDFEPGLIEDFVLTGRMNIELFDFTVIGVTSFDALGDDTIESVQAAEASACAAEQGEYLAFRNWLFEGEPQTREGDFSDSNLIAAADDLGLDADQFAESLLNGVYEDGVIAMVAHGIERGVQGTPTMILNDGVTFYAPAEGYDSLKEMLEAELL